MKSNRKNAMLLWERSYGDSLYAEDFHGYLMCKDGYGDDDYYVYEDGEKIYCGWNIHHILPKAHGGTNSIDNLICVNIGTNEEAADKITFWIDECLYQVKRLNGAYGIIRLQ